MNVKLIANSIFAASILLASAAAQENSSQVKVDLIEKLRSGSIQYGQADEAWAQLRAAIEADPDGNSYSSHSLLARLFAHDQKFDTAIEVLKQGFDYYFRKLDDPGSEGNWAVAHYFSKEIASYAARSSTPKIGDEVLDLLIPLLRKKVASSKTPDGNSRLLASSVALRSQSLSAQEARMLIEAEFTRVQKDFESNLKNKFAAVALIEATKSMAIPPYQGGRTDLDWVNKLLAFVTDLKEQPDIHKIGWGMEFCEINGFVIEHILNDFPDDAQRISDDAFRQLEDAGKGDELFSQQLKIYADKLKRLSSEIEEAKRFSTLIGNPTPAFEAAGWINGEPIELQELSGKIVLLDFTAVWCGPCIEQLPDLKALRRDFEDRGLVIISVTEQYDYTWDDEKKSPMKSENEVGLAGQVEMLEKFVRRHEIPFRLMVTEKDSMFAKSLGVNGIPHAVIIDGNGVVRMIRSGNTPGNAMDLRRQVKSLIENQHVSPGG